VRADAAPEEENLAIRSAARRRPRSRSRCTFDANIRDDHRTGVHSATIPSSTSPTLCSLPVGPYGVDVRRVAHEERDARVAELAQAVHVEGLADRAAHRRT